MSGIKTGTPGFINPVDGKVYTVDPGKPADASVNPIAESADPGDMKVDNEVKDFSKKTKITLGTYLSKATKGSISSYTSVPNKYTIDAPTDSSLETSLRTEGYPSPLTPTSSGNSEKFAADLPSSLSGDFSAFNQGGQKIKKGAAAVDVPNGNTLLPGAKQANSPVQVYQTLAFAPNYRVPETLFTAEDILSPSKTFDPSLIRYAQLSKVNPDVETVVADDLGLKLADIFKTPATLTQDAKNVYPVSVPDALNLTQLAALTTNGYPSPRTEPTGQNTNIFTQNPGSSVSDDYAAAAANAGKTTLISKGKKQEKENEQLLDGNALLQNVKLGENNVVTLPDPLNSYYDVAISPNYRIPGAKFTTEDILSPASKSDYKLLNYSALQLLSAPTQFVPQATSLTQTLAKSVQKPKELTSQYKNFFPINTPDEQNFNPADLFLITSPDGKFPAPLTDPGNQSVFANPLINSYGNNYTILKVNAKDGLQKGKTVDSIQIQDQPPAGPNGNSLLSKIIIENKEISNFEFLKLYVNESLNDNQFYPGTTYLTSDINPLAPPGTFEPLVNDVNVLGKYYGQPGDLVKKDSVTLKELQQKAVEVTSANEFAISPPGPGPLGDELSKITDPGTNVPVPLGKFVNQNSYVDRQLIKPESNSPSLVGKGFSKGKSADSAYDGHNLLKDITGNVKTDKYSTHDSGASYPQNADDGDAAKDEFGASFNGGEAIPPANPISEYAPDQSTNILSLGNNRFAPRARVKSTFNPTLRVIGQDGRLQPVSHLRMAKIGTGLLQRASGEIPALLEGQFNPTDNIAEAGALLPSVVQAGITKVANQQLLASDVLASLTTDPENLEEDPDSLMNIARGFVGNDESWGAAYSSVETYDDPGSAIGLALTMILMTLAIIGLYSIFIQVGAESGPKAKIDANGFRSKGHYIFQEPENVLSVVPDIYEVFGIKKTNNPFMRCVGFGVQGFFLGSSKADISFSEIAQALLGIGLDAIIGEGSPMNANIVVCRTILRSGLTFAIATDRIIRRSQSSGVGAAKEILNLLKVFRSSKLVAGLNVFASLGDNLIDRTRYLTRESESNSGAVVEIIPTDNNPDSTHGTVKKSRLSTTDLTLAWSTQRAPSMYLLPNNVKNLTTLFDSGVPKYVGNVPSNNSNPKSKSQGKPSDSPRISKDDRVAFEKQLDAEYVPFSFHDVRTNEIISFHAFLTSLSDDYSSSYDTVDAFGRVEPIKIYKGTTRKIGISFIIASTSPDDHTEMWYKINKLSTMVYPQYTAGRDLVNTKAGGSEYYQFKAPFSQLIGASPLIRIRLGDLIRSNYSKFSLSRLFGAASGNMKLPASTTDDKVVNIDAENAGENVPVDQAPEGTEVQVTLPPENIVQIINDRYKNVDVLAAAQQSWSPLIAKLGAPSATSDPSAAAVLSTRAAKITAKVKEGSNIKDKEFEIDVAVNSLKITEAGKAAITEKAKASAKTSLDAFLNPQSNAIVKSFESAAGKGLAGFIESMNFDWYNQTTWETDLGSTAPKMCKVTISFSPMHDISPGIDNDGYNRAPIYPVRDFSVPEQ